MVPNGLFPGRVAGGRGGRGIPEANGLFPGRTAGGFGETEGVTVGALFEFGAGGFGVVTS